MLSDGVCADHRLHRLSVMVLGHATTSDQDAEVRALAACNIGDFAVSLESDSLLEQLAVAARALSTDTSVKVKLELAVGIASLATALRSSGSRS